MRVIHSCVLCILSVFYAQVSFGQISNQKPISISSVSEKSIAENLQELTQGLQSMGKGTISSIKVFSAYLDVFNEKADYGPMWYGETIQVHQNGWLIVFDCDKKIDKRYWSSKHQLFLPKDKSAYFSMYKCRFGEDGQIPSHGFADRSQKWDETASRLYDIIEAQSE